jgi:hypothetical protein
MVYLTKSRINRALSAGLLVHAFKLVVKPPPACNLAVMNGSGNINKCSGNGPVEAKTKTDVTL